MIFLPKTWFSLSELTWRSRHAYWRLLRQHYCLQTRVGEWYPKSALFSKKCTFSRFSKKCTFYVDLLGAVHKLLSVALCCASGIEKFEPRRWFPVATTWRLLRRQYCLQTRVDEWHPKSALFSKKCTFSRLKSALFWWKVHFFEKSALFRYHSSTRDWRQYCRRMSL